MENTALPAENPGEQPEAKSAAERRSTFEVLKDFMLFRERPKTSAENPKDRPERMRTGIRGLFTNYVEHQPVKSTETPSFLNPLTELPAPIVPETPPLMMRPEAGGFVNPNEEKNEAQEQPEAASTTKAKRQVQERLKAIEHNYQKTKAETPERSTHQVQSVKEVLEARLVEQPIIERMQAKKTAEQLAASHYEGERPETVLEKVEEVAEKNVPLEALYERRHEVKDEDILSSGVMGDGSLAPVPPPLSMYQQYMSPLPPVPTAEPPKPARSKVSAMQKFGQQPDTYKDAAIKGAAGALAALLIALMLALL